MATRTCCTTTSCGKSCDRAGEPGVGRAMEPTLLIRPFAAHEWRTYRVLRLAALEDSPDAFGRTLAEEEHRAEAEWASRLQSGSDHAWSWPLVAEIGAEPVGLVWSRIDSSRSDVATVYQMWVAPHRRRCGIGRALLEETIAWARARNVRHLLLSVTCGDTPALRLYQRLGFRPVGDPQPLRPGSDLLAQPMDLALGEDASG
jgi:ribosomal protein S18 acetylase RimI-like enzyme